jgi:hypothetical protein
MITVAETHEYFGKARKLLDEDTQKNIIDYLSLHPKAGAVIEGTGGIRKLRWGRNDKGKSGGVRVIYYYHSAKLPLYLLTLFTKGQSDNLSNAEKNGLGKLVKILKKHGLENDHE